MGPTKWRRRDFLSTMTAVGGAGSLAWLAGSGEAAAHGDSRRRCAAPLAEKLTWRPPNTSGYTPLEITAAGNYALDPDIDYAVTKLDTEGSVQFFGGRNIVVIGGEIHNGSLGIRKTTWSGRVMHPRTVHIEGVLLSGEANGDGIWGEAPEAIIQVENCRIEGRRGIKAGVHGDVIQMWGGVDELRIDGLSGFSSYQGIFSKVEPDKTDKPIGVYKMRRVDLHPAGEPYESGLPILLWFGSSDGYSPLRFELERGSVWVQNASHQQFRDALWPKPDPEHIHEDGIGTYAVWPDLTPTGMTGLLVQDWNGNYGRVYHGGGRWGEYVPAGVAGVNYVSPGYL